MLLVKFPGVRPVCKSNEWERRRPTSTSDRECKKCTTCNYSFQWRRITCGSLIDAQCVDCRQCREGTYKSFPCSETADTACNPCESISNCESSLTTTSSYLQCNNSTLSWCTQCQLDYRFNQSSIFPLNGYATECIPCSVCEDTYYRARNCSQVNSTDTVCLKCPDSPNCQPSTSLCSISSNSICPIGSCNEGYSNSEASPSCISEFITS